MSTGFKIMPGDNLLLILRSKFVEIATPAPYTYDLGIAAIARQDYGTTCKTWDNPSEPQ
jgi:hypothetical protein